MSEKHLYQEQPGTYHIYEGKAPEYRAPKAVSFSGDLMAVENFLSTRILNEEPDNVSNPGKTKSIIMVNAEKKTIVLHTNPTDPASGTITAAAKDNPDIEELGINGGGTFTREQLIKRLRFLPQLFQNKDEHTQLLSGLQRFVANTSGKVGADTDQRGNKDLQYQKKVQTGLPELITLFAAPIIGAPEGSFQVEVCLDVTDGGGAKFWLESPELVALQRTAWLHLSNTGLATAQEKGFTIIYS